MTANLKFRIQRLEQRLRERPMPRIVLALRTAEEADIIGYVGNRVSMLKTPDETTADCQARAFKLTGAAVLTTLYSAHGPRQALEREAEARPATRDASGVLSGPEIEPRDPFALAGIGREASREEREKMGAIPVPPERLI